ncbi:hypothetical protein BHM03_00004279 [Ensete ventricosum]|nr:hypothetical protein BHM03_00004279 [Ensete ventricosum]
MVDNLTRGVKDTFRQEKATGGSRRGSPRWETMDGGGTGGVVACAAPTPIHERRMSPIRIESTHAVYRARESSKAYVRGCSSTNQSGVFNTLREAHKLTSAGDVDGLDRLSTPAILRLRPSRRPGGRPSPGSPSGRSGCWRRR